MKQTSSSQEEKKENRKIFSLRLSASERLELENKAAEVGLKLSEYLRQTGLRKKIRAKVPEINREMYLELGRIGNNLNQITKNCHIALQQGKEFNIDINLLQSLTDKLDEVRLSVIGINPEKDDWKTD